MDITLAKASGFTKPAAACGVAFNLPELQGLTIFGAAAPRPSLPCRKILIIVPGRAVAERLSLSARGRAQRAVGGDADPGKKPWSQN
jgi:hypothetical protein